MENISVWQFGVRCDDQRQILLLKLATRHLQQPFADGTFPCKLEGGGYRLHIGKRHTHVKVIDR